MENDTCMAKILGTAIVRRYLPMYRYGTSRDFVGIARRFVTMSSGLLSYEIIRRDLKDSDTHYISHMIEAFQAIGNKLTRREKKTPEELLEIKTLGYLCAVWQAMMVLPSEVLTHPILVRENEEHFKNRLQDFAFFVVWNYCERIDLLEYVY